MARQRRQFRIPHVFALLTGVIFIASAATYIIPSGRYQRQTVTLAVGERTLVIPGTFEALPKRYSLRGILLAEKPTDAPGEGVAPVSLHGFLTAIPRGLEKSADIVFFIFIIGGVFSILQHSGVIPAAIARLLSVLGHSATWMTIVIMVCVGIGGSTLGMGEEFIPLIPVFLLISKRLGYDRIYGLALVMLAADVGFAAATTNPFTVNIAQGIAEIPLNSGIVFRMVFFACCMTVTVSYLLRYGARIRRDPSASLMAHDDFEVENDDLHLHRFTSAHAAVLVSCGAIFAMILAGVQLWDWWMPDLAGGFFLMGLVTIIIMRMPLTDATKAFVKGLEDITVAALVVGFARGIEVVLDDGQIMDTLIHSAATVLQQVPRYVAVEGMLVFQTTLNFLIPSGSGQAAVTMPLMAPLADVLGITRQTAVFAFQCGDGFSNTIIPTSGILMAMLSLARIPYNIWLRFMIPLFLQLLALSAIFLIIAVAIDYR